ncbi:MAG: hypothetical protein U0703_11720 [Anaerolineae bacterium]
MLGFLSQYESLPYHVARLVQEVYADIEARLSPDVCESGSDRGKAPLMETVVAELLRESG